MFMNREDLKTNLNTPGTRGGPGGRDQTLAVKCRKTPENQFFFHKKKYALSRLDQKC